MQGIFINYRREDSEGYAIILQERLAKHFGAGQVFMDVDNIEPGVDFMEAIEKSLDRCQVVLVLIGQRWLDAIDDQGNRRLDNPQDPLRIEIETALASNSRVIPILVRGVLMPEGDKLPESLAPLIRRHAIEISSSRRDYDIERLLTTLEKIPGLAPVARTESTEKSVESEAIEPAPPPRSNAFKHGIAGAGIALALLVMIGLLSTDDTMTTPSPVAVVTAPTAKLEVAPDPKAIRAPIPEARPILNSKVPDINLNGTWYDDNGLRYVIEQQGNNVFATAFNDLLFGTAVKQFSGKIRGDTISYTMQDGFSNAEGTATLNQDRVHLDFTLDYGGGYTERGQLHLEHTPN